MPKLFVDKTIGINAPTAKVWAALTKRQFTDQWTGNFSPGQEFYIESDWQLKSPVLWKGKGGQVIVEGEVTALKPLELLRYTVHDVRGEKGLVSEEDGITFKLSEKNGVTTLHLLQGDFSVIKDGSKYRDMSEKIWDIVLPKIKELAEAM